MLWQARWLHAWSLPRKPDDLSLIPRTHIKVEGETDSTELSSDRHMPCGVLMCTITHNNVFDVYVYLHAYICICVPFAYLVPTEVRGGHQILLIWSYRWLGTTMWSLGTKARPAARAARLNSCAVSPALGFLTTLSHI